MSEQLSRRIKRRTTWAIDGWLLAWMEHAEPTHDMTEPRPLAESDDGDVLMPAGYRNGEPWWEGWWCWWKPTHWPVYLRSRRRNTFVMVERGC